MARRLTEIQKKEIIKGFKNGNSIEELSKEFDCTKSTICRNLKKNLGEENYKNLIEKCRSEKIFLLNKNNNNETKELADNIPTENISNEKFHDEEVNFEASKAFTFIEIPPINHEIDNQPQKDLSSISISDVDFPKTLYFIVDDKIELTTKILGDYPDWQFLPENELTRKTIEIYSDLKIAKRFCSKHQKVIKVPNTNVFRIVAPILISRGISRIVNDDNLIAL